MDLTLARKGALPALHVLIDLLLLYGAFVGALKARLGEWYLNPAAVDLGPAFVVILAVYAVALVASGLYRLRPSEVTLRTLLRVGVALLLAWTVSTTLIYLWQPPRIPPRSVSANHCLLAMVGILGLRVLLRYLHDRRRPPEHAAEAGLEGLLDRPSFAIEHERLGNYLAGRTVLVTGAGGSIGSELARQLVGLRPFRIVCVDVSEYNLYRLENALRLVPFGGALEFRIADIRDEAVMRQIFTSFRPDVVLHAAAYKHVPLMERHPAEAFRNNTLASVGLLRLSEQYDVEQYVLISTDKAVEPASVLGATKRLAEWYVRTAPEPIRTKTVRFGNVLGSQGSIVPLFAEQIRAGGPLTLTHPEMERFFMTAGEACRLILQTLLLESAPTYILDMGPPIKIRDLAARMVRQLRPQGSIEMQYVGVRPGEKLQERLWGPDEHPRPTAHACILGLESAPPFSRAELDAHLAYLEDLSYQERQPALRKALFETRLRTIDEPDGDDGRG